MAYQSDAFQDGAFQEEILAADRYVLEELQSEFKAMEQAVRFDFLEQQANWRLEEI